MSTVRQERPGSALRDSLALGFLTTLPLLLLYELGLATTGTGVRRNAAELLVGLGFAPLGEGAAWVRRAALLALAAACIVRVARAVRLGPAREETAEGSPAGTGELLARHGLRACLEGAVAALLLGPLLVFVLTRLDVEPLRLLPPLATGPPGAPLRLEEAARLVGGAAWEELVFRVGGFALVFLVAARTAAFLGLPRAPALVAAELTAIVASSLAFAAFHLSAATSWLGPGGEAFDASVFWWRTVAGMLLAGLYRWRGLGVAAWAHGLFNLGLFLGVDPGA